MNWIARMLGRVPVYLLDHDGEVTYHWAKRTPFGLTCYRMFPFSKCLLLDGGQVRGVSYVHEWRTP